MAYPQPVQAIKIGGTSGTGQTVGSAEGWEPPLAGNLVLVVLAHSTRAADLDVPSGYTSAGANAGGGPTSRPRTGAYGKIADGSESSVDVAWDTAGQWAAFVFEFDTQGLAINIAAGGNGGNGGDTTSLSSSSTSNITGFGTALFASSEHNGETPSYDNSFTHYDTALAGGSSDLALDVGISSEHADSAGIYETTATWVSSADRAGLILAAGLAQNSDGESLKDYQRSSTYRCALSNGQTAYIEDTNGVSIALGGLNRGQARKAILQDARQLNLQAES